jgi:hypothetical protein
MIGLLGFEIDLAALAANEKYHVDRFSQDIELTVLRGSPICVIFPQLQATPQMIIFYKIVS